MGRVCCMRDLSILIDRNTMKKQLLTAGLSAAVAAVSLLPMSAIPGLGGVANAGTYVEDKSLGQTIYVTGQTAGATYQAAYLSAKPVTKSLKVNACGFATLPDTWPKSTPPALLLPYNAGADYTFRSRIKIGTAFIADDATTPTIATAPTCTGTTPLASAGVRTMTLPDRSVIIKGLAANTTVSVDYLAPIAKNTKVNACGIAVLKAPTLLVAKNLFDDGDNTPKPIGPTMSVTNYDGQFTALPVCRKDSAGAGVLYKQAPN
jgi:hypothetical protein